MEVVGEASNSSIGMSRRRRGRSGRVATTGQLCCEREEFTAEGPTESLSSAGDTE